MSANARHWTSFQSHAGSIEAVRFDFAFAYFW